MSQEIIEVLDHICEKLGIAMDWTSQNIMPQVTDVMNRYTDYNIAILSFKICTTLLLLIVISIIFYKHSFKGYIKAKKEKISTLFYDYNHGYIEINEIGMTVTTIGGVIMVVCLVGLYLTVPNLLSWICVPEIQILKSVQGMM